MEAQVSLRGVYAQTLAGALRAGCFATLEYPSLPLHGLLEQTAACYPGRVATIFFGARLSYRSLNEQANRFAHALLNLGLKRGDRVALMLPNCPQFLISFYGALKAGAIVTAINPLYTPREIEYQLSDAEAETLVTLSKFYPTMEAIRHKTPLQRVIVTSIKEYFPPTLRALFILFKETSRRTSGSPSAQRPHLLVAGPPGRPAQDGCARYQR